MGQSQSDDGEAGGIEGFLHTVLGQIDKRMQTIGSIRDELTEWIRASKSVKIFVTGKTGAGKSTLVNALIGKKVAPEGRDLDPKTAKVKCYESRVSGIQIKVWDSPGLQDGTLREEDYIADMKAKCTEIDLCVFCINVSTARFTNDSTEIQAFKKLTDTFGHSLWNHAMIVLTYANEIQTRNEEMRRAKRANDMDKLSKLFQDKIAEWDAKLRETLKDVVKLDPDCVKDLRIIPAGNRKPSLPDRKHWLSTFWFSALRSMHKRAQPAMVLINHARIVESPESLGEKEGEQFLEDQFLVFTERGDEIGEKMGESELGRMVGLKMGEHFTNGLLARVLMEQIMKGLLKLIKEHKDSGEDDSQQA